MLSRCVAMHCSSSTGHRFPLDQALRRVWNKFVLTTRGNFDTNHRDPILCSSHFEDDQFENLMQFQQGFDKNQTSHLLCTSADSPHDLLGDVSTIKDILNSGSSQTNHLEAFHSLLNHFTPNMIYYEPQAMYSRTLLAAMDYNENCNRQQKTHKVTGEPLWTKRTRKWTLDKAELVPVLTDKTHEYVKELKRALLGMQFEQQVVEVRAKTLTSYQEYPPREDLLLQRISRYSRSEEPATTSTE